MKITPLEIRQKDFEKKLRGYDKDEVSAFLQSLSNEWERVLEENKDLNFKLQQSEKEVAKLREVESSLFKTLKTAEDTGANVIDQANKAAELHMKETQMNAEALLNESKNKARAMIEKAEMEARLIIDELQEAVKNIQQNHRDIQNQRDLAIQELKNLSVTLIEKVERNAQETKEFKLDDYVQRVKRLARESEERIKSEKTDVRIESKIIEVQEEVADKMAAEPVTSPENEKGAADPSTPLDTEELREKIVARQEIEKETVEEEKQEVERVEKVEAVSEEPVSKLETSEELELAAPKEEPVLETEPVSAGDSEERKGPRIARTVSFFDELDIDN